MIYELGDRRPTFEGEYFVADNAAVIGSVALGKNASVWWNVTIRADNDLIRIGENVNVQDGSVVHTDGGVQVTLERNVSVGHLVMLHGCTVRENSLIGIGAIVLNKAVIGRNCLIGAGATVTEGKVIPDGSLVLGVNKIVRSLTPEEIATNTWIAEHYVERAEIYRRGLKPLG
jgi:carbonic anhydrase/acetyltransferase-like protein (isoleucine patch superfamily)